MAERSVMAQIFVFGRVMNDLVPKESQSKQSYVCFDLMERTKNWTQFFQVWAWDADVTRLMQFKVKKDSMISVSYTHLDVYKRQAIKST